MEAPADVAAFRRKAALPISKIIAAADRRAAMEFEAVPFWNETVSFDDFKMARKKIEHNKH